MLVYNVALLKEHASEREALRVSMMALTERLRPRALLKQATDRVASEARALIGEVPAALRENGAAVSLLTAGALLAFDVGRRSGGTTPDGMPPDVVAAAKPVKRKRRHAGLVAVGVGGIGLSIGQLLGTFGSPTPTEVTLLGPLAHRLKKEGQDFVTRHAAGAKQTAANVFGVAGIGASYLALVAGLIEAYERISEDRAPPS